MTTRGRVKQILWGLLVVVACIASLGLLFNGIKGAIIALQVVFFFSIFAGLIIGVLLGIALIGSAFVEGVE